VRGAPRHAAAMAAKRAAVELGRTRAPEAGRPAVRRAAARRRREAAAAEIQRVVRGRMSRRWATEAWGRLVAVRARFLAEAAAAAAAKVCLLVDALCP
jgi:hypothetical protein